MTVTGPGRPEPLGVTAADGGWNVAVCAPDATAVTLCLFEGEAEIARLDLPARTGDVFHGLVAGIGPGTRYGLRAAGPWDPGAGHRFNPAKLLVDPYATRLDRPFALHPAQQDTGEAPDPRDSAAVVPKAIITDLPDTPAPPPRPAAEVIYELHVRGFTTRHPEIPPAQRGTFAGLGHPAAIAHLRDLGVTMVEVMPCAAWIDERHLPPLGLSDYWGYNPVTMMAPDPRLAPGGLAEIRDAVAALHDAGIGCIVDVVFNHTGEGDELGPTLSLRGLGNAAYYRLQPGDARHYVNDAGCGNILACDHPAVVRLVMDSLRLWLRATGIDGFRFDLMPVLGRRLSGFDPKAPLLAAIAQDPVLRERVIIAEPWDIGPDGYQLGAFPAGWGEWNDRFRDTTRRFWRGDGGMIGALATSLAGSGDILAHRHRRVSDSVNYVTAHDGFTMADLVAFTAKRNAANGEHNYDGTDQNFSWNQGIEGPTDNLAVLARRAADIRALLATLLLARGTPMLTMGDEAGRSQGGNNNAYAQDNATAWFDWAGMDTALRDTVAKLVALRLAHPVLTDPLPLTGQPRDASGIPDVAWRRADGAPLAEHDWHDHHNRTLVAALYTPATGATPASRAVLALHAGTDPQPLALPPPRPGFRWQLAFDSTAPAREAPAEAVTLPPRAVLLLIEMPLDHAGAAPGDLLARLSREAGIADGWWDIDGHHHDTGDDTRRALLKALRLPAGTLGEARDSLRLLAEQRDLAPLPPCAIATEGQPGSVAIGPGATGPLRLRLESGETREIPTGAGEPFALRAADGTETIRRRIALPPLSMGRHRLQIGEAGCDLIVAPSQAFMPAALRNGGRRFGLAAQLYAMRRAGDQGIGDFTTLAMLGREAAGQGAAVLGINPLHALFNTDRKRASPYNPSSRYFLDPISIDLAALGLPVAGFAALSAAVAVDHAAIWALKRPLLEQAFARTGADPALDAFIAAGGEGLASFCRYETLAETHGGDWRGWPAALRHPSTATEGDPARLRFHAWLQFIADRQLAAAAGGMEIGLYRDLAVGCAPDGAEAWAEQDRLAAGVSVGAPPDPFSAEGQVWSLPAPDPHAWARVGHAPFGALLAANMRHAGAMRIDHVMGMVRLFCVPEGARGADGAYLHYPFQELLAVARLESQRAGCLLIGEDLGTVPEGTGEALQGAGILSYKVLWFERHGEQFNPPGSYKQDATACVATHDLPTLAGWWQGADIAERAGLGLGGDPAEGLAARRREKLALLAALDEQRDPDGPLDDALAAAVHGFVARTPSLLALAQVDDLAGEASAVNLPGTDTERPNWRRKIQPPVEGLCGTPLARAIIAAMRGGRQ